MEIQSNAVRIHCQEDEAPLSWRQRLHQRAHPSGATTEPENPAVTEPESIGFASHGSSGIVDLGATKTVVGSDRVPGLLENLYPSIRRKVSRCPCHISFRFGNHGTLQSQQALVLPIHDLLLKIAVVPGSTPLLLSNTLLRALGATIDTEQKMIHAKRLQKNFPLTLTNKGLLVWI